ncbi:hypothetical protein G7048_00915 [Diaphorobacter sp. HDW4B]|uniref:hypothetical protein n=1 Tax=Diaphorobacter sp. HDW4B TaxID=2714925 RepID=UPI001408187B|nr:hypothetical protein [Diaphorobacter sp. HDW4B]QIL69078.1 hypothetical protein G7048_00915 [Diaphorobacter sp. HDW4B]
MTKSSISRAGGLLVAGVLGALAASHAQAACYELYSSKNELVYRSTRSPVDLSRPLHQTVPTFAPGTKMVFTPNSQGCEIEINKVQPPTQAIVEIEGAGFRTMSPREPRRGGRS